MVTHLPNNKFIGFGVRISRTISNEKLRKEYLWRKNDESIRKGYISDGLSSSFGDEYADSWVGYRRYKSRKELSTNKGESKDNQSGISQKNGVDGRERLRKMKKTTLKRRGLMKKLLQ